MELDEKGKQWLVWSINCAGLVGIGNGREIKKWQRKTFVSDIVEEDTETDRNTETRVK